MGELTDIIDKVKRYYKFTPSELRGFVISIFAVAFIISFAEWGPGTTFEWGYGLRNFFNASLIVALTFIVRETAHRVGALSIGFKAEYKMWTFGLLAGVVIALVTRGYWWLILPGGIMVHHLGGHRLGFFRYGLNYFGVGMVSAVGPLANIALALFFKIISAFTYNPLIYKAIVLNLLMAVYTILPIPPLDGSRMFFGSRMVYAFILSFVILSSILLFIKVIPAWIAIVASLLLALICWLLYYILWEKGLWGGPYPKS